jgi:acetyl-CoA C-acetyltransferase
MLKEVFLAGGVRTAIGGFGGAFSSTPAPELGSAVCKAALEKSQTPADQVDEIIFGNVLSAGLGQNVARQVALGAGLAESIGATTVNKVCGSGLKSIMLAAQAIQCGDADIIVAGGTENMSRTPHLVEGVREGIRIGNSELVDTLLRDGLWDVYNDVHMGTCGDQCAAKYNFSREDQDDFAVESYQRAIKAADEGITSDEIVGVETTSRRQSITIDRDEEPGRFNEEKLRQLRPAFGKEGTVTAGNASSINDGAAAFVVLSGEKVKELGITPQARILGYASAAREPEWFTLAPISAISKLLENLTLTVNEIDLFEVNEAFSTVVMAAMKDLNIPHEKMNVLGGAVALGHPIGASGARTLVTLLNAMKHNHATTGIDSLCIGGGEAVAMAVEI